jgi:7,8-dihydroneopterin 2',3'-cyclic phosphate phosphodiesterase
MKSVGMKELIEEAKKIKNAELREKVVDVLKNPGLSSKDFKKYKSVGIEDVRTPFSVAGGASVERDVLNHTIAVVDACERVAEVVEKRYGIKLNKDHLRAGALLHDIMKVFEWKVGAAGAEHSGIMLDHTMLAVAELYRRDFPEQVIHMIASHFGEAGPTPPRSFEALILHHVDSMLSIAEYHMYAAASPQEMPVVLLDEEMIKRISGEVSESKQTEKTKQKPE